MFSRPSSCQGCRGLSSLEGKAGGCPSRCDPEHAGSLHFWPPLPCCQGGFFPSLTRLFISVSPISGFMYSRVPFLSSLPLILLIQGRINRVIIAP